MDSGKQQSRVLNITVSSASGSGAINGDWDICRRIRVVPVNETTSYDVSITDADGDKIFERLGMRGTLSEIQYLSMAIAATVSISNSSDDGTYKVKFDLH